MYRVTIYRNKKLIETKMFADIVAAAMYIDQYRKETNNEIYSKIEEVKNGTNTKRTNNH